MRALFAEFDKDNSGAVSVDEAKLMLNKLGMSENEVVAMVDLHDANHDGELQYDEFVSFVLHQP